LPNTTLYQGESPCTNKDSKTCYEFLEPLPVIDENGKNAEATAIEIIPEQQSIGKSFNNFYDIAIGIGSVLAVIMIALYGFRYMTGEKSVHEISQLKTKIMNVVLGILLLLGIYVILNTINPNLLKVEPSIESLELLASQIDNDAYINSNGIKITSGGGGEYDPNGKDDVMRINKNINQYDALFKKYAQQHGVQCNLLKATMYRESGGNPSARSPVGAIGLMQFMPNTAKHVGFSPSDMLNPEKAIEAAAKYYSILSKVGCNNKIRNNTCDATNPIYTTAAYNGGPGANKESDLCPGKTSWQCTINKGYAETRKYSGVVTSNMTRLVANNWGC
jgi:hypothetical protein